MQSTAKGMQIKVMRVLQKNASNAKVMQIKSNAGKQVLQKMQSNAKVMRSNAK
jgi:hypothetical protein